MPRQRDPRRDEAFEIWKKSNGEKLLKVIASELDCSDTQIRKWKSLDKWERKLKGNVTNSKRNVTKQKKHGGQPGNKGNPHPTPKFPKRNKESVKHGFFSMIFPDDDETKEIIEAIELKSPVDIIWENIVIKYTAIARAQKIMFVKDQKDTTRVVKKHKESADMEETEWEIQFAWDKQAALLNAQSRAMSELRSLIKDFLSITGQDDHRRLQLEKMQHDMKMNEERLKLDQQKASGDGDTDDQLIDDWVDSVMDSDEDE